MTASAPATTPAPIGFWRKLWRHPILPILLIIPLTQVLRDEYPLSHYPMFSGPSSGPLRFQYVADGEGKPLPLTWHTGVTPSQAGKKYNRHKLELSRASERSSGVRGRDLPEAVRRSISREAALATLEFLRDLSRTRYSNRELSGVLRLMEVTVKRSADGLDESEEVLAELEPES